MKRTDIRTRAGAIALALASLTFAPAQSPPAESTPPPAAANNPASGPVKDPLDPAFRDPSPQTPAGSNDPLARRSNAGSLDAGNDDLLRRARLRVFDQHLTSARAEAGQARKELPVTANSERPALEARIAALDEFCRRLEHDMKTPDDSRLTSPGNTKFGGSTYHDPFMPTDPRNADRLQQRIAQYEAAYEAQARLGAAKFKGETVFIQMKKIPAIDAQSALQKRFKTYTGDLVFGIVERTQSVWIGGDAENVKMAVEFLRGLDEQTRVPHPDKLQDPNAPSRPGNADPLENRGYRSPGKGSPPADSSLAPAPSSAPPASPQR